MNARTARTTVRDAIARRVQRTREERARGGGIWAALAELFTRTDDQAIDRTTERLRELEEARTRDNRLFDSEGPTDRDLRPGGRYERITGRRPSRYWWPL